MEDTRKLAAELAKALREAGNAGLIIQTDGEDVNTFLQGKKITIIEAINSAMVANTEFRDLFFKCLIAFAYDHPHLIVKNVPCDCDACQNERMMASTFTNTKAEA